MVTTINVNLSNKKDFYSKYSNNKISNELVEYIYDECYGDNFKNKIVVNINTKLNISKSEKNHMIDTIRRTFGLMVQDELHYYEKKSNLNALLLIIGIVLIIVYYSNIASILREIILILGWLAVWESVYSILFDSSKDRMRIIRLKELAKARVYFVESNDSNS